MSSPAGRWLYRDAGPVVRSYALTRGRTRPQGVVFGLVDVVVAAGEPAPDALWLGPEHERLLDLCRRPTAVADLASEIDLPLGVVRVLLGDLSQQGLITLVSTPRGRPPEESVIRSVLDGLRAL
jgi:hypothetical protein